MTKIVVISGKAIYLHSKISHGGLAHLARATDWQSVGDRFESDILHIKGIKRFIDKVSLFFYPYNSTIHSFLRII